MIAKIIALAVVLLIGQSEAAMMESTTLNLGSRYYGFTSNIFLSQDKLTYLATKRTITIAVYGEENPPFAMSTINGSYRGINADYLQVMKEALSVNLGIKYYHSQSLALRALQSGDVDLVLSSNDIPKALTTPFVTSKLLFQAYPTLVTLRSKGMEPFYRLDRPVSVAISQHYPSEGFIKSVFKDAIITNYDNNYLALSSVTTGENEYFFGDNITSNFIINRDFHLKLDISHYWRSPQTGSHFIAKESQSRLIEIINTFISTLGTSIDTQVSQAWIDSGNLTFLNKPLVLTPKEKRWIEKNATLRTLINPYYAPFTLLDENREIRGLVGDILNLVQLQTGLHFNPVIAKSNSDIGDIMRKGDWDIIPTVTYSAEREKKMAFTQPFIATPFVVVTQNENQKKEIFKAGSRMAIPAYYSLKEKLLQQYPDVNWIIVVNASTAMSNLHLGNVDGVVTTQLAAQYIIDHYYPETMSYRQIPNQPSAQISFAVPRDKPELQSILNKALAEIPPKEIINLAGKWIKMPNVKIETWDLYSRPFYILTAGAALLILSSLLWGAYLLRVIRREKASQTALEYQLSLRQTLSNSIPVPIYITTAEGELESFNSAFTAFFSSEFQKDIRYSLFDRRSPLVDIFSVIRKEMQKGIPPDTVASHQLVLNNGTEDRTILHWVTLCPLPAPLSPVLICGWQDITDSLNLMKALQVEKDKAIEASRAKSIFLAKMSHEIRTPVSAIMGFLELLTTQSQTEQEAKESLQLAYATAQSLIGLIGDVLDVEKIESGNFELVSEWVYIEALTQSTIANFSGLVRQKNINLTVNYQLSAGKILWLDPQAIKQIITNLLSNAIKFTNNGDIKIKVQTLQREKDTAQLKLSVKDSGVGISKKEQQLLFKPFSQASFGKTQMGSGLGLTICQELVERMHGSINVDSQLGVGTTMTVLITTQLSDIEPADFISDNISIPLPSALRIIIAEDSPSNRLLLRRQLGILGYYVDEAENGEQAFKLIEQREYDLLITDINMPGMDGIILTQKIRKINPSLIVWGLTANALPDEKERCLASGMDLCLIKPINLPQLTAAFKNLIRHPKKSVNTGTPALLDAPISTELLNEHISMQILFNNAMGDTNFIFELIEQAYHENIRDLSELKKAMLYRERKTIQSYLHRINGTAQLVGAMSIHELAEELENAIATEQPFHLIESGIKSLEQQINALEKVIAIVLKKD